MSTAENPPQQQQEQQQQQAVPLLIVKPPATKANAAAATALNNEEEGFFESTPAANPKKKKTQASKGGSNNSNPQGVAAAASNRKTTPTSPKDFLTAVHQHEQQSSTPTSQHSPNRQHAISNNNNNNNKDPENFIQLVATNGATSSCSSYTISSQQQYAHTNNGGAVSEKDLQIFKQLEEKSVAILAAMDTKMIDSLQRKEYEIVKGFQAIITQLTHEIKSLNERLHKQDLFLLRDTTILSLERQLKFFRDQTFDLSTRTNDLEAQVRMLLTLNGDKDDQIACLMESLRNSKFETMTLTQKKAAGAAAAHNHPSNMLQIDTRSTQMNKSIVAAETIASPKQNTSQLILQNHSNSHSHAKQSSSKQFTQHLQISSIVSESSIIDLSSILSRNNNNNNNNQSNNLNLTQDNSVSAVLPEAQATLTSETKQSIVEWATRLMQAKQQEIDQTKKQLVETKRCLQKYVRLQADESELHELFVKAIGEAKTAVMRRNANSQDRFLEADRVHIITKFLSSAKFMDIVKAKIFNEKCCDNFNCKFNLHELNASDSFNQPQNQLRSGGSPLQQQPLRSSIYNYISGIDNLITEEQEVQEFTVGGGEASAQKQLHNHDRNMTTPKHDSSSLIHSYHSSEKTRRLRQFVSTSPHTKQQMLNVTSMSAGKPSNFVSGMLAASTNIGLTSTTTSGRNRSMTGSNINNFNSSSGNKYDGININYYNQPAAAVGRSTITSTAAAVLMSSNNGWESTSNAPVAAGAGGSSGAAMSLLCDANFIRERSKNQQEIYRINNQFRRLLKDEKIHDQDIEKRLTGFLNSAIHKLSYDEDFKMQQIQQQQQQQQQQQYQSQQQQEGGNLNGFGSAGVAPFPAYLAGSEEVKPASGNFSHLPKLVSGNGTGQTLTPASPSFRQNMALRVAYKHGKIFQQ